MGKIFCVHPFVRFLSYDEIADKVGDGSYYPTYRVRNVDHEHCGRQRKNDEYPDYSEYANAEDGHDDGQQPVRQPAHIRNEDLHPAEQKVRCAVDKKSKFTLFDDRGVGVVYG